MKNISLKTFLILLYSSLSFLFLVMTIIIFVNIKSANTAREFSIDYSDLYITWTDMQHAQQAFLINYSKDPIFFQTEQNKNLRKSQIVYTKYINTIDSLKNTNFVIKNKLSDQLSVDKDHITKVENIFEQLSHLLFLRGSQKTGIIGDCFSYYNLAYSYTFDPQMKIYLEKMNDYFLQYLNSPNQILYQNFLNVYTQINSYIVNHSTTANADIIDSNLVIAQNTNLSSNFINNTNSFKRAFSKLVSLDRKIFLNNHANLMTQWVDLNQTMGTEFKKGKIEVASLQHYYIQRVQRIIVISITFILLFFLILSFTLPFLLSSKIKELQEFIEPLKKGQIPEHKIEKLEVSAFTELIDISDNLKQIIISLKNASVFATEIGRSNFDFDFKPIGDTDELGNALVLLRNNLKKAQEDESVRRKEDEIRQWANIGIAKFSDILRQSAKDITELSLIIIKELVNYLDANQGGVFILNDSNPDEVKLELAASYAYSKERKKKKEFILGEGLIGTCAVEKATIYMTDIPQDYISISSGLGAANPRSLLIVPLKFEENVLGVLEIASFNLLEQYQIKFVERIAESIASAISITKINERTAKLLEISKVEAEQRALKEEELRQNLEELQATQERAAQRELELDSLIELVNKVAFIVELDIDGNIVDIPTRIVQTFKLERNEIIGRHLSEFDFNPQSELASPEFWQELLSGKEKFTQQKFISEDKTYWLNDYILPSLDTSGNVQKFVCIIFDNTEQVNNQNELQKYADELKSKEQEIVEKVKELEKAKAKTDEIILELQGIFQGIDKTVLRAEYTPEGIFLDANDLHTKVLGYQKEQMKGKSILEFLEQKDREDFMILWKEIAAGNSKELTVKRINKSTNKDIWLINQYNPIIDKTGKVVKILYLAIDITELQETKEEEERLIREFEGTLQGIDKILLRAEYTAEGIFIDSNELHTTVLGYQKEQMKGKSVLDFIEQSEQEDFIKFWEKIRKGNEEELTVKRKNKSTGDDIWLVNHYIPIFNNYGKVYKILYLAVDITDQKQKEQKNITFREKLLKEEQKSKKQLLSLFDKTNEAIQLLSNNKFVDCNNASLDMFGYKSKQEFLDLHPAEVSPEFQPDGKDSKTKADEMMKLAIENETHTFEWIHRRQDGSDFPCEVTLISFEIDSEQMLYAVIKDLTKEKEDQLKLEESYKQEKETKERFQKLAREFRTKLEKFDIELERKEAEIFILKRQINDLKNKK